MQTEKFHDIVSNKHGLNIVHWAIELKLYFSMELMSCMSSLVKIVK